MSLETKDYIGFFENGQYPKYNALPLPASLRNQVETEHIYSWRKFFAPGINMQQPEGVSFRYHSKKFRYYTTLFMK